MVWRDDETNLLHAGVLAVVVLVAFPPADPPLWLPGPFPDGRHTCPLTAAVALTLLPLAVGGAGLLLSRPRLARVAADAAMAIGLLALLAGVVVACSGVVGYLVQADYLAAGAAAFLLKPFRVKDVQQPPGT